MVLLGLSVVSVSATGIFSINIFTGTRNTMYPADAAGAPGVRATNWNNLTGSGSAIASLGAGSIVDQSGVADPNLSITLTPSSNFSDRNPGVTNESKMFNCVVDKNPGGPSVLQIDGIPYAKYGIYWYHLPDGGDGIRGGYIAVSNSVSGELIYRYLKSESNDVNNTILPRPSDSGSNYVQSFTATIPTNATWADIDPGQYAVISGLTNSSITIYVNTLGQGNGDLSGHTVSGGSPHPRFKYCGFQIVQESTATVTNLHFGTAAPNLLVDGTSGSQVNVVGDKSDGTSADVTFDSSYVSSDTNIFTVSASGSLLPGTNSGTADLIVAYTNSASTVLYATQSVATLAPTALRLTLSATNLLSGTNGAGDTAQATLYADFGSINNVDVSAFNNVTFGAGPAGVATITPSGAVTAVGAGTITVTGHYFNLSATNTASSTAFTPAGAVPAISVKFTDSSHKQMTFHDLSGATGVRCGYWNNLLLNFGDITNELASVMDYRGNILANTTVQQIPGALYQHGISSTGPQTTNESVMFGIYPDLGMNDGTTVLSTMVVSNVPYSSYDVYCYVENDTGSSGTNRPGEFIIDGVTQYRINSMSQPNFPDNDGNGYVQATPQPQGLPASVSQIPFGNYVKFSNITDKDLTISYGAVGQDWIGDAASVTRLRVTGIQIVKSLVGLTATNIYLSGGVVPALLPGNPATVSESVLADFSDGTMGGNITALPGIGFASSDTNVFMVNTNGVITPGLTPGVANLTVTYQANNLVVSVTNLAPTSVSVGAVPNTVYLDGVLGVQPANATVHATFPGHPNVDISGFTSVGYVDQGSSVATLNADGSITASSQGSADLGASYLGATYVTPNAFTVSSINNSAVLKHLYTFTNTTQVIDTVGGANGTVYPPLGSNKPITLDGSRAIFPGDGTYANAPYIALPAGLINQMGDVSIEMWCGRSQLNNWARYWSFGNTSKGTDPHNSGSGITGMQMMDSYSSTGTPNFQFHPSGWEDLKNTFNFTNGAEYQVVTILAPNAGTAYLYINGVLITNATPSVGFLSSSVNDTVDWLGVSFYNDHPLAGWINQLAIYEGVLSSSQIAADYAAGQSVFLPPSTVSTTVVPMTFSASGGKLNLSWPSDHLGWTLQVQTNSLGKGLGTNWVNVPSSTTVTNMSIPVNTSDASVFYRLMYKP